MYCRSIDPDPAALGVGTDLLHRFTWPTNMIYGMLWSILLNLSLQKNKTNEAFSKLANSVFEIWCKGLACAYELVPPDLGQHGATPPQQELGELLCYREVQGLWKLHSSLLQLQLLKGCTWCSHICLCKWREAQATPLSAPFEWQWVAPPRHSPQAETQTQYTLGWY